MGQEEADLSTIWVALGMARDRYAVVFREARDFDKGELEALYQRRYDEMQLVRDKVEERMRMLTELEEYDYGL